MGPTARRGVGGGRNICHPPPVRCAHGSRPLRGDPPRCLTDLYDHLMVVESITQDREEAELCIQRLRIVEDPPEALVASIAFP